MNVLVGYASALGSTREIADHVAKRLAAGGIKATARSIAEVTDLEGYDACVLGSAVHNMTWLPPAVTFARTHTAELAALPVWLFSVGSKDSLSGPIGRRMAARYPVPKGIAELQDVIRPRDHAIFTGVIRRDQYPWPSHLALRMMGGHYGDFRDWPEIDRWADGIARTLSATTLSGGS